MQKGRKYRAAQPRGNLDPCNYSNRMPMRCDFEGSFVYNGNVELIPTWITRGVCVYNPLVPSWQITNTYLIAAVPMSIQLLVRPQFGGAGWHVQIGVGDGGGLMLAEWEFTGTFIACPFLSNWLSATPPTTVTLSGLFGGFFTMDALPVRYSDE